MARDFFGLEKGFDIYAENGDIAVRVFHGSGAPGGDAGEQDASPIGSIFLRTDGTGGVYKKIANAGAAADWDEVGNVAIDELSWRNETVVAATTDTLSAGAGIDPSGWTDNDSGIDATNWNIGDFVIGDTDGTPVLFEITAKASATSITLTAATQAIAANDTFVVQAYLPDSPAAQEQQAIIHFPSATGAAVKISDFNWALADGINLTGSYSSQNGTVAPNDTVETAISKLDGNQADLTTLTGVSQGDVDLGTFTGSIISDNTTIKPALQELETQIESLETQVTLGGVTTVQTIDSVLVDSVLACEWEVHARLDSAPTQVKVFKIFAVHNGHTGADATAVDDSVFAKLKLGANFSTTVSVDLNGATTSQIMRLQVQAAAATTFTVRRTIISA